MSTTADRVCPTHGDVGSLPSHKVCPECGAGLVMKGTLRTAGENIVHSAAIGLGLGVGMELGRDLVNGIEDAVGGIFD
jgi:hypothetical protein